MKGRQTRLGTLAAAPILFALAFSAPGCMTRRDVYEDIYRNRTAAYGAWKRAREGGKGELPVLQGDLALPSAVLIAIGNNKQLRVILEQKENANGRITEAYAQALPTVELTESYTRLDKVSSFNAGAGTVDIGSVNNWAVSFVLKQPVFRGGAIAAGIRAAKLFDYLTDEQVAGGVQDVVFQARAAYYKVLLNVELVKVNEGARDMAYRHLTDVEKKRAAGTASQYDVLRARVDVTNVEAQVIQQQNALHLAVTTLLNTLGVSQESDVRLTDALTYNPFTPSLDDAVDRGFHDRPEILQAELQIRLNREAILDAWSGWLPKFDLQATQKYARPDPHSETTIEWGHAYNLGGTLTWTLFDGLATYGRVQQARADLRGSVIQLAATEEQVLLDIKQAIFDVQDADKFVKSQSANIERANEALRLAEVGYKAGVNTELDMLDARQALTQSRALYYQAVYQYETAKLSYERAIGMLREPPVPVDVKSQAPAP